MKLVPQVIGLASSLFERRGGDLLRYLRRRVKNDTDALDLAQESFLRFIRLAKPDQVNNPEAYLFRIAGNLLWEHQLRERSFVGQEASDECAMAEETPFDLAVSAEEASCLHLALMELPATRRAVLVLHLRDGLTYAQIAAQIGVSVSMVKKHIAKGLVSCRARLRELAKDREC